MVDTMHVRFTGRNWPATILATIAVSLLGTTPVLASDPAESVSVAIPDGSGILVHQVQSPYQAGTTEIRVLVPEKPEPKRPYHVLYVLPVEAGSGNAWGNAMLEVQKADLHGRHNLICVYPTFSHLPWYCDHPTDSGLRQETYLLKTVVPFVDRTYPTVADASGRLLVGFSKSGWGAFSLLLRHPKTFGRAAVWDAPLMVAKPNQYGMGPIFGHQQNFEKYRISSLLKESASLLNGETRFALLGFGNFREHHQSAHSLMEGLGISHVYRDGPKREHCWGSGWLGEAISILAAPINDHSD